ncbi:hypothetical protein ACFVFQ_00710 [Streptomyces sp. NPDC057743]|uniref:hypothetical protein n=1 Tax=Streptomyces sp. NPDC057743 TaxID=3346236 RepID=UPI0036B70C7E
MPASWASEGVADLAERLFARPSAHDLRHPPRTVRAYGEDRSVGARTVALREVLAAATGRIGPPTLYGGAAAGPVVRWRDERHTVLLDGDAEGLRLAVRPTAELEAAEAAHFRPAGRTDATAYHRQLPYLWQLYRGTGTPPLHFPSGPVAGDWRWLEGSLTALLRAWWEQLPGQIGADQAGFALVPRERGDRPPATLSVLCSADEGVLLLVDDRGVPGGTPEPELRARGWRGPLRGWWQRDFHDLGADGATAAAALAVAELRARGVWNPAHLRVADVRCECGGLLLLPGLALAGG